jgi:preprotein translocase subunit SecG
MDIMLIIKVVQVVTSIILTILILIQSKGKGLASGIGDSISMYRSRRGLEKAIFIATIAMTVIVVVNSILILVLS